MCPLAGEDAEPWLFQVTYLSSATVKTSVSVSLPRSSTLVKLKSAIASLVGGGIATSALDVYTLAGGSRRVANKIIDKRVGGSPGECTHRPWLCECFTWFFRLTLQLNLRIWG